MLLSLNKKVSGALLATFVGAAMALSCCSTGADSASGSADSEGQSEGAHAQSTDDVTGQAVPLGVGGEEVVVGLTYVPSVQFAPVYVAGADEVFRAAGIGVSIRHHGADEGLFTALASGEEDVTVASGDEVLQARAAGLDIVAIGAYYHEYPVVIITKEESGIDSVEGLKGKKVGLPGEFGSNWFGLLAALEAADMTTQDIEVVSIGYTQAASLAQGSVDAIVGFVNSDAVQVQELGIAANIIELAPGGVPLVGATIVSTQEWVDAHPELATATVGAITAGVERVVKNPQHALEISSHWDKSLEDAQVRQVAARMLEATIELWKTADGSVSAVQDLATWEEMAPFLSEILDLDLGGMNAAGAVTNAYAE